MNESQKVMENIRVWIVIFVILFSMFLASFFGSALAITRSVQAYGKCSRVADTEFRACYDEARKFF